MTVCLPFSKIIFLTVNPRTGCILYGFILKLIIHLVFFFAYLNDIGTVLLSPSRRQKNRPRPLKKS